MEYGKNERTNIFFHPSIHPTNHLLIAAKLVLSHIHINLSRAMACDNHATVIFHRRKDNSVYNSNN